MHFKYAVHANVVLLKGRKLIVNGLYLNCTQDFWLVELFVQVESDISNEQYFYVFLLTQDNKTRTGKGQTCKYDRFMYKFI